jgi:hypothetical protein
MHSAHDRARAVRGVSLSAPGRLLTLLLSFLVCAGPAFGVVTTYTDKASFDAAAAALPGPSWTIDFESSTPPLTIAENDSLDNVTFTNFALGDATSLLVDDQFDTFSGDNYLGVDFADNSNLIIGGDEFDMTFRELGALGFYVISAEEPGTSIFDDDIQLHIPALAATALLDVDAEDSTLSDGSHVYFVGIVSDELGFTSAQIQYSTSAEGATAFTIDDITAVVPEPAALLLALFAASFFMFRRRTR